MWYGAGGRVLGETYPGTSIHWLGGTRATSAPDPTPGEGSDLSYFFPGGADVPQVPSGRIPGGGNQPDQHPGLIFTPTCAVYHCDPGRGPPALLALA